MKRLYASRPFPQEALGEIKDKMLSWASRFGIFLWLDSNGYADKYGKYDAILGISDFGFRISDLTTDVPSENPKSEIRNSELRDWRFGHLCYDYKNVLEPKLHSRHPQNTGFEPASFFVPDVVAYILRGTSELIIETLEVAPEKVLQEIMTAQLPTPAPLQQVNFRRQIDKHAYLEKLSALRQHIYDGDCYEINFCSEVFAENVLLKPLDAYRALNVASPAPFSAFYKNEDSYLMCASPERFMTKHGRKIISQPIKGTAKRGQSLAEDDALKAALVASEKERAENVMIVDLVRNDLAKSCKAGSVSVEELFGIYTFPQVHQMISTVSGELRDDVEIMEAIINAFPMGSMTGAPKFRVMELIEKYEEARRELFSGSVGYISPDGDADFNVIIRSLFYDASTMRLSYQTGGAITWGSTPEEEWEEMRLKAEAMERIFR